MPDAVETKQSVASWLLPATFFSAVPFSMSSTLLSIYLRGQGQETEEILGWVAATWIVGRLVALWVVPMEFLAGKRRLLLVLQGAVIAMTAALALASWQVAPSLAVVAVAWLLAILSASHITVLDGLFVTELNERAQIKYTLIAPLFWSLGPIAMNGGLVSAVGRLEKGVSAGVAWGIGFASTAIVLTAILVWQSRSLPDPERDVLGSEDSLVSKSIAAIREIARKPALLAMLAVSVLIALPASITSSATLDFILSIDAATQQNTGQWYGGAIALPAFAVVLLGMFWILKWGLEKVFFRAVVFTNGTIVFALFAALLGPEAARPLLLALLTLANMSAMLATFVSGLYVVQQVAPGRFSMSAHALATVATALVASSMRAFTDLLQERLGYSVLFAFLVLLGLAAMALARHAPFLQKYREEAGPPPRELHPV